MATSQNGYTANDPSRTKVWEIPGTDRRVRLRTGSPGALLVHLAAWFDKNIEDIDAGQLDDWGYAERPIRGSTTELSNHASGTALDLNATRHPLGVRGTFTAAQAAKIRAQLLRYDGCIRWGGDYSRRADEMHFEIVRDPETCDAVWRRLNQHDQEDEMTDAQMQELKAFIESNNQKYAKACNNYTRQVLSSTAKALLSADASTDQAQADRIIAALDDEAAELAKKLMPATTVQDSPQ